MMKCYLVEAIVCLKSFQGHCFGQRLDVQLNSGENCRSLALKAYLVFHSSFLNEVARFLHKQKVIYFKAFH
jgi:hypothetical protein